MGKLYEDSKNLIHLFNYNRDIESTRGLDTCSSIYIDKSTGNLISRTTETNCPFGFYPGSHYSSTYEREVSYSELKEILSNPKNAAEIGYPLRYKSLNEHNWEKWLIENHFV